MRKRFFSFFLALAMLSGVSFTMAQTPSPAQGQNAAQTQNASAQNLELQNLPIRHPIETLTSEEGVSVHIMVSQLNSTEQLYYTPIPTIEINRTRCYDPQSKTFTVKVGFPSKTEEIRKLLSSKGYNESRLVQMPLVGYEIAVSYGNESQVIRYFNGSVQILGSINCCAEITNAAILQALNKDINSVNVEVKIICDYQKLFGSSAKMGFKSAFKQKLQETILAGKSEVYMSRDSFKQLTRDASNEVQSSMNSKGYIIVIGDGVDDLMDVIFKQNPNMFVEKTMEEMGKLTESYWMYVPEFGLKEIKPDEISDLKKEWEKLDEVRKYIITHWKTLKEIRKQSKDIEDFKKRVSNSGSISGGGGGGFNFCNILSANASASGSGSYSYDKSSSHYTFTWKDLYDMTAQESFNENDFYNKSMEHWKGEVRKVSSLPKDYKVIRVSDDELNSISDYYFQKSTIDVTAEPLTFQTSIEKVIERDKKAEAEAIAKAAAEEAAMVKAVAEAMAKAKAEVEAMVKARAAAEVASKASAKAKAAAEEAAKAKAAVENAKGGGWSAKFKRITLKMKATTKAKSAEEEAAKAKIETAKAKAADEEAAKARIEAAKAKAAAEAMAKAMATAELHQVIFTW